MRAAGTASTFSGREQALLRAAVRVVAAKGLRGLTHRAVDAEAGLPEGSCSASMRTRLALLTQLTEYVAAHFARDIEQLTHRLEERPGADRVDRARLAVRETSSMLRSWLREPELLLARMELSLEGSRQPEIARIGREQSRQLVAIIEHAMTSAGHEDCRTRATTLVAGVDGILLHALGEAPRGRATYVRDNLEMLMGTLVGAEPEVI